MSPKPTDDPPFVDSTAALASMYQAPLAQFVARRTALVAQLKRSGHKDVAARMAAAAKPSRAAHAVNQVFWRARPTYEGVLEAGTAARAAQQARLLGDGATDLAETLRLRDEAIGAAVLEAERIARGDGAPLSALTNAQVRASFEALAAHGLESRLPHGHLASDVALPGLAAFAGLILPTTAPAAPVRRFEVVARRADRDDAPPQAPVPDPRITEAEAAITDLEQRQAGASDRLAELHRSIAAAQDVAAAAERTAAEAARAAAAACQAVQRAEASRLAAEQDLAQVGDHLTRAHARLRDLQAEAASDAGSPEPPPRPGRVSHGARRSPHPRR